MNNSMNTSNQMKTPVGSDSTYYSVPQICSKKLAELKENRNKEEVKK